MWADTDVQLVSAQEGGGGQAYSSKIRADFTAEWWVPPGLYRVPGITAPGALVVVEPVEEKTAVVKASVGRYLIYTLGHQSKPPVITASCASEVEQRGACGLAKSRWRQPHAAQFSGLTWQYGWVVGDALLWQADAALVLGLVRQAAKRSGKQAVHRRYSSEPIMQLLYGEKGAHEEEPPAFARADSPTGGQWQQLEAVDGLVVQGMAVRPATSAEAGTPSHGGVGGEARFHVTWWR